jgi:hypothetical protein
VMGDRNRKHDAARWKFGQRAMEAWNHRIIMIVHCTMRKAGNALARISALMRRAAHFGTLTGDNELIHPRTDC